MTPFQAHVQARWSRDFPQWAALREDLTTGDSAPYHLVIRYMVSSPANANNTLCVAFTGDDITVKFAVQGSHEHYDPDHYQPLGCSQKPGVEQWDDAYDDAMSAYIQPVLQDKLFAVWYGDNKSALVSDVSGFTRQNHIHKYQYESWTLPLTRVPVQTAQ